MNTNLYFHDCELNIIKYSLKNYKEEIYQGLKEDINNFEAEKNFEYLVKDLEHRTEELRHIDSLIWRIDEEMKERLKEGDSIPF